MQHLIPNWKLTDLKDPKLSETEVRADIQILGEAREKIVQEIFDRREWLSHRKLRKIRDKDFKKVYTREIPNSSNW